MVEPTRLFDPEFEDQVAQAASARAVEGLDYDQKEAARAMQLQRIFKVPAPVISGDLEGFERQQKTKLIHEMVRDNPAIQDYINGNPLAARISQDDYPQLDTWHKSMREFIRPPALFDRVESGLKQVGQSFVSGLVAAPLKAGAIASRDFLEARREGLDEATSPGGYDAEDPASRAAFRQRRGVIHPTGEVVEERRQALDEAVAKPIEEHPLYQAGQFVEDVAKYLMPADERFQDEFFASKLPQAFGSIASFIVGGGLLRATGAPTAFNVASLGSMQQGVSQFEDAISAGASLEDALKASGYGNLIGTSEALPIIHFLDRLDKGTGGSLKKAIGRVLLQGGEEFIQEFGQKVGENLTANKFVGYDPSRGTFTGAMDDASVGFTAGAIMQTMAEMIGGKRARVSAQSVANRIKTANAYLAAGEVPPVGVDPFFDLQHAEQAFSDLKQFTDMLGDAQKTQTRELSPDLAEQFAKQGVGEFKIGIPPEAVLELYGTKQPSADDGLLGFISDLNDQLEIAAQTGGDVEISLAQLLAHGDPKVIEKIEESLRLREGGMTAKEAEEFKQAEKETPAEEAKEAGEETEPQPPTSIDDLARREAGFDTYAQRVRPQVTLKKVKEEPDPNYPNDPPFSHFDILNEKGQKVGDLQVQETEKGVLYVPWIGGYKPRASEKKRQLGQPHVFGLHSTMSLFEQLSKEYPNATAIGGYRVTGARSANPEWAQMPLKTFREKPREAAEFLAQINGEVGQFQEAPEGSITSDIDGLQVQWRPTEFLTADEKKTQDVLAQIKKMIAPNAVLGVVDTIKGKAAGTEDNAEFYGVYHGPSSAILVSLKSPYQVGTLLHEFIHHLRDGFFTNEEWAQLEAEAKSEGWVKKHKISEQYTSGNSDVQIEEAIAEEFREWFEKTVGGKETSNREYVTPPEAEKLFQKIAKLIERIKEFLKSKFGDDITADKLFHQVLIGEIGSRERGDWSGQEAQAQVRGMVAKASQDEETQMFERGAALGMTQEQFKKFMKLLEQRRAEDEARARRRAEAKADLRKTQEWKEYLPKAREQAEAEVYSSPAIRVDEYFRSGRVDGVDVEKVRIGTEFLTREQKEALGANIYAKDGVDPNDVAPIFGFNSGQAMIHAMSAVRAERDRSGLTIAAFKERLVADRQQELMSEKFLGPAIESELKDAREDILTETQMDLLHEELLAAMLQAKQYNPAVGAPFSKEDVKQAAKAAFQNIPVKRAEKMEQYLKDAGKAGNAAFAALLKQDFAEALRQKQRQILSTYFAAESKALNKAKAQLESQANRFKPREVKSVDHATTVFVKRLLSKAGFRVNRSEEELDQGMEDHGFASLDTYVQHMRGDGWEITIPDYLVREEVKPVEEMSVEELYDFKDAITSMATAGKGIRQILSAGAAQDFDVYKVEVLRRVKSRPMRDVKVPERRAYTWDAMLARMEEIVKDLDGRDEPNGPLYNVLIRGTAEAKHTEYSLQEKLVEKLNAIKGFAKGWRGSLKEPVDNSILVDPRTGALFDLTKGDLIGIMLNFGSESNIEKFTAGFIDRSAIPGESRKDRSKRLKDDAKVLALRLESMIDLNATKEDREFVQAIWDIFHDWQPLINDMYTELSGIGPKFIPPRKVQSQHGTFKGGYFPILWDQMRSNINVVEEQQTNLNKLFSGNYFKATVANHYTKTRTDAVDVVAFSNITEQLGQRMQQVIHDLAYRRAIMEVNKVIYDKEIRAAIRDHYGKEYADQLEPWVKDIANHFNSNERAIEGLNWALRAMRFNTIAYVLPFNIKTILSPSVGLMNPAAIMRTLFRPQESTQEAWDKSQEIPHTFRNMNRDMREKMDQLIVSKGWDSFVAEAVKWGFRPIVKLEQAFRITTFLDAYKKAIAEGKNEGDAIAIGDSAVRTYHGAHGLPDLPAIMRSSEAAKAFTMFYGYFSTMHNWRRQVPDAVRRRDWDTMMTVAWGTTLLPALFSMALYNKYDGDDEDKSIFRWFRNFAKAVALETSGGIPGIREAANYWLEWQEPKTALEGIVKSVALTAKDVKRFSEGKDVKSPIQHTANTIGLTTGLPLGQIGRTAQGIRDVQTGAQDRPQNIWQWFNLITHGKVEEKKRR